jgi:acyl transferase domain-containing protein/NADPH:quinone reductase-like Zn-dependent oxidoreductase/acyl carrier protein/NADP-dependent 3-hydroxy acid dehydrogenase YdfG/SAM-dependent methyltransferase
VNSIHYLRDEIAVVGWACRLPGAKSVTDLWSLLLEGRCAITQVPADRFSLDRFGHPRRQERGKSYTWAAGILDDLWGFDPSVFGISPREAEQMDPQQRILLQLTWEALEDAGIRPSSIAGTNVGVFVGASQADYGHKFFGDHAVADSHFATGTALAIVANRISYIYDLRGPSLTVDTACSSSLVALHQAVEALRSGRIETAIVGGINVIASPASFIAFSQASMLSPTGLCQAFSAKADGFVRAEGGTVFVLRKAAHAHGSRNPVRGLILATDVNSDGRTNGISLPSMEAQEVLLQRIYSRAAIDPNRLAFVEAHGTGTPAGDPIEANALGRSLGHERSDPLPIGSIKTNIGHLEPASGLAGVLKALLALNHGILPPSLHFSEPNPNIDFGRLNLTVSDQSLLLPDSPLRCAGVNSFGFGGTNAHAIVAAGRKNPMPVVGHAAGTSVFVLSAESKPALVELAQKYAERVTHLSDEDTATLASAIVHRRDHLGDRIVISSCASENVIEALNAYVSGTDNAHVTAGTAVGDDMPVAFVYSGNGSQWVGMGLSAYRHSAPFRAHFSLIDSLFQQIAGWSLKEALFSETLQDRLPLTSVAQPLIFAIQSSITAALRARGIRPAAVLGHSVGEVAAAEAAGILDLRTAVEVIHVRSTHQELIRGAGRMMAVLASMEKAEELLAAVEHVELAAINSPRAVTVAGPADALAAFKALAESRGTAVIDLELEYPFHSSLMAPVEPRLRVDLKEITPRDGDIPFVSTVTGACLPGSRLGGSYWWRNVREPVQFIGAVRAAAKLGARYFLEIGPRGTLVKHVSDSLQGEVTGFASVAVLDRNDDGVDPFDKALAKAMVSGARVDLDAIFGQDPGPAITLPHYPWQQTEFRYGPTSEAVGIETDWHPFAGGRHTSDGLEWHAPIDTARFADLVDHKVGEQVIFPGAGFLEIAFSVGRQWLKTENIVITNFEILKPLDLTNGETREVMTRVSPGSNTIEIFSRPRLAHVAWLLHCRGKIVHGNTTTDVRGPARPQAGKSLSREEIYRIADGSGLHYGPAFRLVQNVIVHDNTHMSVQLDAPRTTSTPFLLDPMRLDCSTHGLFTVFPELRAEERGVTYIPVRLDEASLYKPGALPERAFIEILVKSERSVLANYYLYGADDEIVAILRGVRCQAIPVRRTPALESIALVELPHLFDGTIAGKTGVAATARDVLMKAQAMSAPDDAIPANEATLLIEGWATAAAYEIACGLADGLVVDVDLLVAAARVPEEMRPWLVKLMLDLEAAELASQEEGAWVLIRDASLPSSASVIKALAAEYPDRAAELLLAGAITSFSQHVATNRAVAMQPDSIIPKAALEFYDSTNVAIAESSEVFWRLLRDIKGLWSKDRAARVLQVGYGPLTHALAEQAAADNLRLTVWEPERRRFERAELRLPKNGDVTLLSAEQKDKLETYDLIVSVEGLHRLPADVGLAQVKDMLAPGGLLLALEPRPSLFKNLVFGLDPHWFVTGNADYPVQSLHSPDQWTLAVEQAGFDYAEARPIQCGADSASLIVAEIRRNAANAIDIAAKPARSALVIAPSADSVFASKLSAPAADLNASMLVGLYDFPATAPETVVLMPPRAAEHEDPVAALTRRCLEIKACAEKIGNTPATTLWLVFSGALGGDTADVRPVETGAWAFSRVLANEFQKLNVRRIDIAPHLTPDVAAEQVRKVILSGTPETEIRIDGSAIRVVRVGPLRSAREATGASAAPAARLQRHTTGGQRLSWQPIERVRPGAGEVEVAVEATGLNFRDLMWTLSLLPDDMLEDGFSGPTLGLECAGRVSQIGPSVKDMKVGDRVVTFAASAFSTHVIVPAAQIAKVPAEMPFESAATIPVAFLTAYYSLVALAKLKRGEWVLIHGGAGAVGLAAVQIALARGAKVIATAGSRAKRGLVRALGVRHVLDSRSTAFVDEVREITGTGVDVVLNSLAGEAMERSIACLRPFGRFVELGKRDYVSNTHIGLRPFRKNLSYFGVDVDQLIMGRKAQGERVYRDMMQMFAKGTLTPLPYSVFESGGVSEAFQLMQYSSHIGKIVIRPPRAGAVRAANKPLVISAQGTHVVTGAFGGFGLETAKWLVDRGARHLVLIGRRGAADAAAKAVLDGFLQRGVKVIADPCDVSDLRALEKLFEKTHATMPPVVGVMHAAMVLDDAIITGLDQERFTRVLTPKVTGAENLDLVTRGLQLDYFVLFSSVTTLMGNPGQGNYVAANAYMEGLARRRRREGLPALAIGWGPITDVGVVARNERLQSNLQKLTGVSGMRAREALDLMAQALQQPAGAADLAVMTISPNEGSFSAERLPVLRSPTYAAMVRTDRDHGKSEAGRIDLRALARTENTDVLRRKVADVIVAQLARVLHSREEDISRVRTLGEIGLDSLMAIELVMNLEDCFGFHFSLAGSAGTLTIPGVVDEILGQIDVGHSADEAALTTLAEQHMPKVEPGQIQAFKGMMTDEAQKAKRLLS